MQIQVYKKKSIPHYNWTTCKIYDDENGVICFNHGPRDLNHQTREKVFTFNTDVIEYYWVDSPFSLHISLDREENTLHYYANIHAFPLFGEDNLSFIDYDLDVVRLDEESAFIVDQEEFIEHGELYNYSNEIKTMVPKAADYVVNLLNNEPLFQKPAQLNAFDRIDRGARDFLAQWTSHPAILDFT